MEFVSGNLFIREMRFNKAGEANEGHAHNFDHTTYVVAGAIRVDRLNEQDEIIQSVEKKAKDGKNWVLILANARHRVIALEDNTVAHCIYSHRNPQGEIVQEFTGWEKAYN